MKETPINSLMTSDVGLLPRTTPVHTVQSDQSLFDALVISQAECVRHLPVFDNQDIFLGIVTQTYLTNAHFRVIEMQRTLIERAIENPTEELPVANRELQSLSMEDALLGIGNRRAMEMDMEHRHSLPMRHRCTYTVALIDIDNIKSCNDCYGHLAGDSDPQRSHQRDSTGNSQIRPPVPLRRGGPGRLHWVTQQASGLTSLSTATHLPVAGINTTDPEYLPFPPEPVCL